MQHKITERGLIALLAVYFGQDPYSEPSGVYGGGDARAGQAVWRQRTNMGGAIRRMCDGLRENGFLADWDRFHYSQRHKLSHRCRLEDE